ncbi:MAG TPA: hypothetical protein VGM51_05220 [Armatimonadota bacterium]|jgi:hypothetical protein
MSIPTINLIPAAYYLRKKVRVAWLLAALLILAEAAGLVAFGMFQNNVAKDLAARQGVAQAAVTEIAGINKKADDATAAVKGVLEKTTFIDTAVNPVTGKNAGWAKVFNSIANYTYPGAVVSDITPTPGSVSVTMHVRLPESKRMAQATLVNMTTRNLRRCPIIDSVMAVSYGAASTDTSGSGSSVGAQSLSGGPPMPGGPPMAGGPPMPGGMNPNSPMSIASPATGASGQYNYALGGASGMPAAAAPSGPPQPAMYDVEIAIDLLNKIDIATPPGAAQPQVQ